MHPETQRMLQKPERRCTNTILRAVVDEANPSFDKTAMAAVLQLDQEFERLGDLLRNQEAGAVEDGFRARVAEHVGAIAVGARPATNLFMERREDNAASLASVRAEVELRQQSIVRKAKPQVALLVRGALAAVSKYREREEATEAASCARVALPFEPSPVFQCIVSAEARLVEMSRFEPSMETIRDHLGKFITAFNGRSKQK